MLKFFKGLLQSVRLARPTDELPAAPVPETTKGLTGLTDLHTGATAETSVTPLITRAAEAVPHRAEPLRDELSDTEQLLRARKPIKSEDEAADESLAQDKTRNG